MKEYSFCEAKKILRSARFIYPYSMTFNSKIMMLETNERKYLLKERYDDALRKETKVLTLLQRSHFEHIPYFYGIVNVEGKKVILQEYIKGKKFEENKELFQTHFREIAVIMAKLHSIKQKRRQSCFYFLKKECQSLRRLYESVTAASKKLYFYNTDEYLTYSEKYLGLFEKIVLGSEEALSDKINPSLINREPEFILSEKRKIYIVDWEYPEFGDYAQDIANISLNYIFPSMDLKGFMRFYAKAEPLPENLYLRIYMYLFASLLHKILYYITDLSCSEVYKQLPPKVLSVIARNTLTAGIRRIDAAYCKLNSLKNP